MEAIDRPELDQLESPSEAPIEALRPTVDIVPLGPPGCGKGTASKRVSQRLGVPHVSTGDMLRALDRDSDLGRRVFALIDEGNFVSDELITEMLQARIAELDGAPDGLILDGFPRNVGQLPIYEEMCRQAGRQPVFVELVAPDEVCVERMEQRAIEENRADDTPAAISRRLAVYREETAPLLDELHRRGQVVQVDALASPDEVAQAVIEAVSPEPSIEL